MYEAQEGAGRLTGPILLTANPEWCCRVFGISLDVLPNLEPTPWVTTLLEGKMR